MQQLTMAEQTLWSDLKHRVVDAMFDDQFPENGNFRKQSHKGRDYIYYVGYQTAAGGQREAKQYSKYVGPADDPAIAKIVSDFTRRKSGYKERRNLVSALKGLGLPAAPSMVGEVVDGLWKAGVFRMRCVLVGTCAFQTYAGSMGVRFPVAPTMTGDVDLAQFRSISMLIDDQTPPLLDVLRRIDASFGAEAHPLHRRRTMAFTNDKGFRVEFLSPNRGSDDNAMVPTRLPALGTAASPMRFLDFLIKDPQRSVLLHKAGVLVNVPAPQRFAVHKMIVSQRRPATSRDKARKDLQQASLLFEAAKTSGDLVDFGDAFLEAWDRGPSWRAALIAAEKAMAAPIQAMVVDARHAVFEERGEDPLAAEAEIKAATDGTRRPRRRTTARAAGRGWDGPGR